MSFAACTLVEQVILGKVPLVRAEAVLADEFVACVVQVRQALEDIRAKKPVLVVDYRPRALMTLLCFELYIERNQSG